MIIGITGTLGAGKGEVAEYLVKQKGFKHYSSRAQIVAEIEHRGLPVNRDTMTAVANDMRRTHDPAYPQPQSYEQALADHAENAVMESVREVAGAAFLKAHGAFLIGVDADPRIRYERAIKRGSSTDHIDFETFVAQEKREMQNTDPTKQNIGAIMKMADAVLTNNGTKEELHQQIEQTLQTFSASDKD
ncbi:AAA family ATPase [Candidatus Kaiserbacteria bacterium]|nr:AAA family ATPase [Candidatus Kaiserbacteria bacterium]